MKATASLLATLDDDKQGPSGNNENSKPKRRVLSRLRALVVAPAKRQHCNDESSSTAAESSTTNDSNDSACYHHHNTLLSIDNHHFYNKQRLSDMSPDEMIRYVTSQIIGRCLVIDTAFGAKLKLYCDYTASGQDLEFVLDLMTRVEEYYANTHTEMSTTGAYMNNLLNEAELAILKTMRASERDYFVVGGGSGSTYAIEMAQKFLGTYVAPATKEVMMKLFPDGTTWDDLKSKLREKGELPLVIVSHYEHHSNEVTWRNQLCDVVECKPRHDGHIDLDRLEWLLQRPQYQNRTIIASLSAGSNVTGLKTYIVETATSMKRYNALVFFDFAAVGPYVAIDLSRKTDDGRCLIDGIYLSPHKFLGGPGSCGVLVFNRKCYNGAVDPTHGGGGTVDFVGRHGQLFSREPTHREKSGTPGILQIIKASLALQLKSILQPIIEKREKQHLKRFMTAIRSMPNLRLLGPSGEAPDDKVAIMSFLIAHNDGPRGPRYLHQNFVVRLLNDIFGIQARAGCSCAGPYGMYLLNIDDDDGERLRFWIEAHDHLNDPVQLHGFKIGWSRVNLHYTLTNDEVDYLIFAINYICDYGYRFLPVYQFNPIEGQWNHVDMPETKQHPHLFGFDSLLSDERRYVESDAARLRMFDRQRQDAIALLDTLPPSRELDSIKEMPLTFFYVEKNMLLERDKIIAKAAAYNTFYDH